jgi:N4-gp56 family major capsid protein
MASQPKKVFELASDPTTTTETAGSSFTAYALEPVQWLKEIIDVAKKRHFAAQAVYQTVLPDGTKDVVIPYRSNYLQTWNAVVGEATEVNFTKLDNLDGVTLTPAESNGGVRISNRALRLNALDLLSSAKEELIYHAGDLVDLAVMTALKASANQSTSTVRGAQTCYGGDARAESELAAGDTITTDMIADAKTKLQTTIVKYWNPAAPAAEATSTAVKPPWYSEAGDPFVCLIAPEQEGAFLKDSQFTNVAEYGAREVVLNGEIGSYLGIKMLVTPNTPSFTTSSALDGGANAGVNGHRCILMKGKKAGALAWGQKPKLYAYDNVEKLSKELILEMAYQSKVIHTSAMVFLDVADK